MEAFFIYLAKSSLVLTIFYLTYTFFLSKETLFRFNRYFLISGILFSVCLPFIYLTKNVSIIIPELDTIANATKTSLAKKSNMNWINTSIFYIYVLGTIFFVAKLAVQSIQLKKLIAYGVKTTINNHIKSEQYIKPFSFFNKIIYNPNLHDKDELNAIIAHEQVHVRQVHSFDILLVELLLVFQWLNPIAWLYRLSLKQNLEFIADTANEHIKACRKQYQYVLLNQSIGKQQLAIINPFYNSLIKKRIVMINQNPSNKLKAFKSLIILPLLALFLVSFNIKTNYIVNSKGLHNTTTGIMEFVINKDTTDDELLHMKNDLAKEEFEFSYTTVRNENGEIKSLFIEIAGGNNAKGEVRSRYNSASDNDTIRTTYILIDKENNSINIGNDATNSATSHKITKFKWSKDGSESNTETITINTNDGKKEIMVNGQLIDEHQLQELDSLTENNTFVFIGNKDHHKTKIKSSSKQHVYIHSGETGDHDVKIIEKKGSGFIFLDTDNNKKPLFYINGKKSAAKTMNEINPNHIETINVLKREAAIKKYGKKAKHGVIEITLKDK